MISVKVGQFESQYVAKVNRRGFQQ